MKETFADRARKITNKYKRRLGDNFDKGDSLALEAMNQELAALREEQELERMKYQPNETIGLPKHWDGSWLLPYANTVKGLLRFNTENNPIELGTANISANKLYSNTANLKTPTFASKPVSEILSQSGANNLRPASGSTLSGISGGGEAFSSRVPWIGAAAGAVGSLLMNKQLDLPEYNYEEYNPARLAPNLVDYSREREQAMRERDIANAVIRKNARGLGSQNALMENILAGTTATQRATGEQFGKSLENEGNVNAQIKNQADQFNAQQRMQATQINNQNKLYANQIKRENEMINAERKNAQIQGVVDSVTGYAKDRMAADQYDQMIGIMAPDNYGVFKGEDSWLRKALQVSPKMDIKLTKTDSIKREKGGYIGGIQLFGDEEYGKLMMRVNKSNKK